jgi:hypothetical protein
VPVLQGVSLFSLLVIIPLACCYLVAHPVGPGGVLERMRLVPASPPLADQTSIQAERLRQLPGTPVRMGTNAHHNLGAFGDGLRRPARLDELLETIKLLRSQVKGTECELMGYAAPPNVVGNRRHCANISLQHLIRHHLFLALAPSSPFPFPLSLERTHGSLY